jgi:putative aldouronate transport system permease protein
LSIIVALLLNELINKKYKKLIQTAIILPHFVSWVVISGLIYALLSPNVGLIKDIYSALGIESKPIDLLTSKKYFRALLIISHSWRNVGMASIMYTAAIAGISPALYEAAVIDGANRWKQAWHITLPGIRNTILILFIFRVGAILNADFEQVFSLSNSIVLDVSDILDTFIYRVGLQQSEISLATAAGLFKTVIAVILIMLTNWMARSIDEESALF